MSMMSRLLSRGGNPGLNVLLQLMGQVHSNPNVPDLQVMRKQVSRIVQRCANKR